MEKCQISALFWVNSIILQGVLSSQKYLYINCSAIWIEKTTLQYISFKKETSAVSLQESRAVPVREKCMDFLGLQICTVL